MRDNYINTRRTEMGLKIVWKNIINNKKYIIKQYTKEPDSLLFYNTLLYVVRNKEPVFLNMFTCINDAIKSANSNSKEFYEINHI